MQQLPMAPPETDDAALRAELEKWRARVPKLASALRQRTEEAERLRAELAARQENPAAGDDLAPSGAGARAREAHMAELEARLADLKERYKSAQAELHKRQLDIDELKTETADWKRKWQEATHTLDEQSGAAGEIRAEVDRLRAELDVARRDLSAACEARAAATQALTQTQAERDSLRERNEQLFETTEMANRQIESLTDSLAEVRQARQTERTQVESAASAIAEAEQARAAAEQALADAQAAAAAELAQARADAAAELESATAAARREAEAATAADRQDLQAVQGELDAVRQQLEALRAGELEQRAEAQRLAEVVETAQRTVQERDAERRDLSERLQGRDMRIQHLEAQLSERSALVMTLEQEQARLASELQQAVLAGEEMEGARLRAERDAKEYADHVAQLDAKLERQKSLMDDLERELAEANRSLTGSRRPAASAAEAGSAGALSTDAKLLRILNQQLADARARNEALLERIRGLEAAARGPGPDDELLRIHGVGPKLADQLHALGIHRLQQIAELDEAALEDSDHVLFAHRSRILRDHWIEQAAALTRH